MRLFLYRLTVQRTDGSIFAVQIPREVSTCDPSRLNGIPLTFDPDAMQTLAA